MKTISITLTPAQDKAFHFAAADPKEWISMATGHRIGTIIDKLYNLEVEYSVINPNVPTVPTDKIQAALSWIARNPQAGPLYPDDQFNPDAPFPS
jgi:hypothetical protein